MNRQLVYVSLSRLHCLSYSSVSFTCKFPIELHCKRYCLCDWSREERERFSGILWGLRSVWLLIEFEFLHLLQIHSSNWPETMSCIDYELIEAWVELPVASCLLPVASFQLPVASCKLQWTCCQFPCYDQLRSMIQFRLFGERPASTFRPNNNGQ